MENKDEINPNIRDQATGCVLHEEIVPHEFFNIKFWTVLLLIINGFLLLGSILRTIHEMSIWGWIVTIILVGEYALWIVGFRLWSSVKVSGFWLIFVLTHLLFVTQVFMLAKDIHQRRRLDAPPQVSYKGYIDPLVKSVIQQNLLRDRAAKKAITNALIMLRAVVLFLIFFCFFLNFWSSRLRTFFKALNGKCPLCKHGSLSNNGQPKKNKAWKCDACLHDVIWKKG